MLEFMTKWALLLLLIRLATAGSNYSLCNTEYICGSYGICNPTQGDCFCADTFSAISPTNASDGCNLGKDYRTQFISLKGVGYSSYQASDPFYSSYASSSCENACLQNNTCYAAFFNGSGDCHLLLRKPGSLLYTNDQNDVAFIYVAGKSCRGCGLAVGAIIGIALGCFIVLICLIVLAYCCIKKNIKTPKIPDENPKMGLIGPIQYSYFEINKMTKGFKEKIGHGGYADVFKGSTASGMQLAVKVIKAAESQVKCFNREITILSVIHHLNLVDFVGYCSENTKMILVYKFMENSSLDKWIFNNSADPLSWAKRFNIITGVACGMTYLHEQCGSIVLHLDLKPQNILLDEKFIPKVADFGLSRLLDRDQSMTFTQAIRGSPLYIAPECMMGAGLNEKMDVYSFGIIILEIVGGRSIMDMSGSALAEAVSGIEREDFFPFELVDAAIHTAVDEIQVRRVIRIAFHCLLTPSERPTMSAVLHMLQGRIPIPAISAPQEANLKSCFASKHSPLAYVATPIMSYSYDRQISPSPNK